MKKSLRVVCMIFAFISVLFVLNNVSLADTAETAETLKTPEQMLEAVDSWGEKGDSGLTKSTKNVMGTIINVIRIVGTGIAIIMITYVAIKYMSAAPSEKAEFKKSATALIVGAIVLFAATNILTVISNFASANIK